MAEILSLVDLTIIDFQMILVCIVLFTIYLRLSSSVLFKPLLDHFERREALTTGAEDAAIESLEEAARLRSIYDETIEAARAEAVREKLAKVSEAALEASNIVSQAESEAKAAIESGRAELATLETKLRGDLQADTAELSKQLAERILVGGGASTTASFVGIMLATVGALLLSSDVAYAGGGHGHVPSIGDTFLFWPNFIVFVGVLFYILRKPFMTFWSERIETISTAVHAGEKAREDAQASLAEANILFARVDSDASELRTRIEKEADAECERIMTEAKEKSVRIAERASDSKEAERNHLEARLREELADSVVAGAEKILAEKIDSQKDSELRGSVVSGASSILH